jgi:hypothetical protein
MGEGVELRTTADKGEGIFATRSFPLGETVMVGRIDSELDHNHSHASQVSEHRFVSHGGLVPKVNHSCEPNCGIICGSRPRGPARWSRCGEPRGGPAARRRRVA